MYEALDALCLIVLFGWAYSVAKKKKRDEIGWGLVAAAAFYAVGMTMERLIAPQMGWSPGCAKAFAYIGGGLAGVIVNLILMLKKPMAPPSQDGGGQPPKPDSSGDQEVPPEEKPAGQPPVQPMAAVQPPSGSAASGWETLLARFWPSCIVALLYLATQFEPVTAWLKSQGYEPRFPPVREIALVPLLAAQAWILSRRFAITLLVALLVTMYIPALNWMEWRWGRGSDYYSHGYIIPIVVGALIWRLRGRLAILKPADDLRVGGLILLVAGLFVLFVGAFLRAYSIQGISLVMVLCGIVCLLCGKALSRQLAFPLLFIIAMIPLPMHMIDESSFKLKMLASKASVKTVDVLHSLGLHSYIVIRDGSYIRWEVGKPVLERLKGQLAQQKAELARIEKELREQGGPAAELLQGTSLEEILRTQSEDELRRLGIPAPILGHAKSVASQIREMDEIVGTQMDKIVIGDVCSGLRSLIALIAFGALFAYITKLSLPSKIILFAAGIPISVLSNTWRVVTLNLVACHWGSLTTNPDGWVHDMTGYGIFAVAFVLYFALERLLNWFEPKRVPSPPAPAPASA